MTMERIDGAKVWPTLGADIQAEIGAMAIELVASQAGMREATDFTGERAYDASLAGICGRLETLVLEAVPALADAGPVPIPASLGRVCRVCRCSQHDACQPPCAWAEDDLCTACVDNGGSGR